MRISRRQTMPPILLVATLGLIGLLMPLALATLPLVNPAGVSLVRSSAESSIGGSQVNMAGVGLEVTGAFDGALDTINSAGVTAFVGHLDPVAVPRNATGAVWTLYNMDAGNP